MFYFYGYKLIVRVRAEFSTEYSLVMFRGICYFYILKKLEVILLLIRLINIIIYIMFLILIFVIL